MDWSLFLTGNFLSENKEGRLPRNLPFNGLKGQFLISGFVDSIQ